MRIIQNRQEYEGAPTALAMGFFDGVHRGHAAVIRAAVQHAQEQNLVPAVFTFTGGGVKGLRLMDEADKHRALKELGVEVCFQPAFDSFSALAAEEFFHGMLLGEYKAKALFCGRNFAFGHGRGGNVDKLSAWCAQAGATLQVVPMATWKGAPVSSSRIRKALEEGEVGESNCMLGRPYGIRFPVQRGQGLGHTLGFPTMNQVFPPGMQAPKQGVYVTGTLLDGTLWPSATGFGTRPTVGGTGVTCETFVPGYQGDLYGEAVRVEFYQRIDDTHKFADVSELKAAVQRWAKKALSWFDATPMA